MHENFKLDLEKLKLALPKVPGILGKEEYFNSAVLIPLIKIDNIYHFLFEKRAANIRQGGEICFPGGEFDPSLDNSFLDTAIRESMEEIGLQKENVRIIGQLDTMVGPMGVTVDSFVGFLSSNDVSKFNFDKTEVERLFTVPVEFFVKNKPERYSVRLEVHPTEVNKNGERVETLPVKDLALPDRYSKPWTGRRHKVLVYKTSGEVIWGITALLIEEVIKKITGDIK